ncbi:hypothetical protein DFH29DRAFT_880147 [Suillus ampliporus]|nr:hypothetical protein DFH29DRAFT_880147 [Suillus ampliporus]
MSIIRGVYMFIVLYDAYPCLLPSRFTTQILFRIWTLWVSSLSAVSVLHYLAFDWHIDADVGFLEGVSKNFGALDDQFAWDHNVSPNSSAVFQGLWLVEPMKGQSSLLITIRNMNTGKYLTSRDDCRVQVLDSNVVLPYDVWQIAQMPDVLGLQNHQLVFWNYYAILGQQTNERWGLQRVSRLGSEIMTVLQSIRIPNTVPWFSYLILSQGLLTEIHNCIKERNYRREIYDCEDFATAFKAAVAD